MRIPSSSCGEDVIVFLINQPFGGESVMSFDGVWRRVLIGVIAFLIGLVGVTGSSRAWAQDRETLLFSVIELPQIRYQPVGRWSVVPIVRSHRQLNDYEDVDEDGFSDYWIGEIAVDMIRELIQPEQWEMSGRYLSLSPDQKSLYVLAPENVVREARELIEYLRGRVLKTASVEVSIYRVVEGEVGPVQSPRVELSHKEADQLIDRAVSRGTLTEVSTRPLALPAGIPHLEQSQVRQSGLIDFDVEIADTSVVGSPIVGLVFEGTRIVARAVGAATGGVFLDLSVTLSDVDRIAENAIRCGGSVVAGDRMMGVDLIDRLQSPLHRVASVVSRFHLKSGHSALIVLATDRVSGSDEWVIRIDGDSSALEENSSLALASGIHLGIFDVLFPPIEVSEPRPQTLSSHEYVHSAEGEAAFSVSAAFSGDEDEGFYSDLLMSLIHSLDQEGHTIRRFGPWNFIVTFPEALKRIRDLDRDLERMRQKTAMLEVELVRTEGEKESTAARFLLPVTTGSPFFASSGEQWLGVTDYQVEVAQKASVADPVVDLLHDGVLIHGVLQTIRENEARLRIALKAQLLQKSKVFETNSATVGLIEQPTFDEVWLGRDLDLTLGRTVKIGGLGAELGGLQLELRVRLRR